MMDKILKEIQLEVIKGEAEKVKQLTEQAINQGIEIRHVIKECLLPVMEKIGNEFCSGEFYIPEVLMSSRAMHASLYVLKSYESRQNADENKVFSKTFTKTMLIGTVAGDLHDIGKNIVSMGMSLARFDLKVIDLGIDVPASAYVEAIKRYHPDILAMSALLTTTMTEMKTVIEAIKAEGLRNEIKIIVGGGPITREYAKAIGADGFAKDVYAASTLIKEMINEP